MNDFEDENYLNEEEEKKDKRIKTLKYIGISLIFIILIVVILFFMKGCTVKKDDNKDLITDLLTAGKEYYETNEYLLPASKGECSSVSLKLLKDYELLKNDKYDECNDEETLVKVCKLESEKYHWVPLLSCNSYKSEDYFLSWKEGTESDLIDGKSDVRFLFLGKYLNLTNASLGEVKELWKDEITLTNYKTLAVTNYYSYRNKEYLWNLNERNYYTSTGDKNKASDVNEYYTASPKSGYTSKDSEDSTVAKWYIVTNEGTRIYWNNGEYSHTKPAGYDYSTDGVYDDVYYARTFTKTSDSLTKAPTKMYECSSTDYTYTVISPNACSEHPTHKTTVREFYTCDGGTTTTTEGATCYYCNDNLKLSGDKLSCGTYSSWAEVDSCTGGTDVCLHQQITVYKWYKIEGEEREYYPSKSGTAANEKIYYKTSPVSKAVKDPTTITTGYKWYKLVTTGTSDYSFTAPSEYDTKTSTYRWTSWTTYSTVKPSNSSDREIKKKQKIKLQEILSTTTEEDWTNLTEEYLTEEEMLAKFNEIGKNVTNFSDINASGDIKYEIKLYFRTLSEEE